MRQKIYLITFSLESIILWEGTIMMQFWTCVQTEFRNCLKDIHRKQRIQTNHNYHHFGNNLGGNPRAI